MARAPWNYTDMREREKLAAYQREDGPFACWLPSGKERMSLCVCVFVCMCRLSRYTVGFLGNCAGDEQGLCFGICGCVFMVFGRVNAGLLALLSGVGKRCM